MFIRHSSAIQSLLRPPELDQQAHLKNLIGATLYDKLLEKGSAKCAATLEGHWYGVSSVAFSPDGAFLATGSNDITARVWEVASGKCAATRAPERL